MGDIGERRKSVRIKKMLTVRYSYTANHNLKKWDMTAIKDISETGMSVTTTQNFSANDILTFLIKLPSQPLEWIEFTGRVVESGVSQSASGKDMLGAYMTRVEFINLEASQKELIREYITWFLKQEGGSRK